MTAWVYCVPTRPDPSSHLPLLSRPEGLFHPGTIKKTLVANPGSRGSSGRREISYARAPTLHVLVSLGAASMLIVTLSLQAVVVWVHLVIALVRAAGRKAGRR